MKKFVVFVSVLVGVVLVAVLILGAIEPTDMVVTRNVMIKAPKEAVFEQMVLFKNWPHWSPWYKMDSANMKMTYTGTDGQPGSGYSWVGSEKTGAGSMKNLSVNGTQMNFQVDFTEPRTGTAQGILKAMDTAGMTKATWGFSMHMPYPMNAMCVFMNMDKMIGGDFENGLNNMKQYVESSAVAAPIASSTEVKEVDFPGHVYQGMRQVVKWADMNKFYMDNTAMLSRALGAKVNGPSSDLYYTWDTATKSSDMVVAFPVSDTATSVKGGVVIHVPAGKAVMAVQKGGYSKSMDTHMAIGKYMAAKGQKQSVVVEEYTVGAKEEPDSNKWVTNIYYLLK